MREPGVARPLAGATDEVDGAGEITEGMGAVLKCGGGEMAVGEVAVIGLVTEVDR